MREIKFRAWDKINKRMCRVIAIQFAKDNTLYQLAWDNFDKNDNIASYRIRFSMIEDCEVMQYTGLKDKNGKEIYEGDIVKNIDSGICEFVDLHWGRFYKDPRKYILIGNVYENPELKEDKNV